MAKFFKNTPNTGDSSAYFFKNITDSFDSSNFNLLANQVFKFEQSPRSEKHNSPGAMQYTDSIANELQNQLGINISQGDAFPNNPNFHSAYFDSIADGTKASKYVISKIANKNPDPFEFYSTYAHGKSYSDLKKEANAGNETAIKQLQTVDNFANDLIAQGYQTKEINFQPKKQKEAYFFKNIVKEKEQTTELPFTDEDTAYMDLSTRFFKRFAQGIAPVPYDPNIPEYETTSELIADVAGGILGNAGLFIGGTFATGGVSVGLQSTKLLKGVKAVVETGKAARAIKTVKDAKTALRVADIGKRGQLLKIQSSGLLSKSKKYSDVIQEIAISSPKLARAVDSGARNIFTISAIGQAKLPYHADVADRLSQLGTDSLFGLANTAAGLPRVLAGTTRLSTPQQVTEAGLTFLAGAGGDLGMTDMTPSERFAQGLAFTAFHFATQGASKLFVQDQQFNFLVNAGYSAKEANKILRESGDITRAVFNRIKNKYIPRPLEQQNLWKGKKKLGKEDELIDVISFYTAGKPQTGQQLKGEGRTRVIIQDQDGNRSNILLSTFTKNYKKVDKKELFKNESDVKISLLQNLDEPIPPKLPKGTKPAPGSPREIYEKVYRRVRALLNKPEIVKLRKSEKEKINELMTGKKDINKMNTSELSIMADSYDVGLKIKDKRPNRHGLNHPDIEPKLGKQAFALNKLLLPVATTTRSLGKKFNSSATIEFADKLIEFTYTKAGIEGFNAQFLKDQRNKYKKVLKKDELRKISQVLDPDFYGGEGAVLPKKLQKGVKTKVRDKEIDIHEEILKDYAFANNQNFAQMAGAGVKIKISQPKGKSFKKQNIWEATYEKEGETYTITGRDLGGKANILQIFNKNFTQLADDLLPVGTPGNKTGKQRLVTLTSGEKVALKSIKTNYVPNYVPRILTEQAKKLFKNENSTFRTNVINKLIKDDPDLKKDLAKANKIADTDKRDAAIKKVKVIAEQKANEIFDHIPEHGVYGQQFSRRIPLPSRMAFDKDGIEIPLSNFADVKKGDIINGKKIAKLLDVYERDMTKIQVDYARRVAHFTSAQKVWKYFDTGKGDFGKLKTQISKDIKSDDVNDFLDNAVNRQIVGYERDSVLDLISQPLRSVWGVSANFGLSAPTSGFKNLLLGQREILTTYNFRDVFKAYASIMKDPSTNAQLTRRSGAFELGQSELQILDSYRGVGKGTIDAIGRIGLMAPTERANRVMSLVAGEYAAQSALKVLLGKSTGLGNVSVSRARQLLTDTFNIDVDAVIKRQSFSQKELQKIRHMAHAMTQGSAELPFLPLWMSNPIAKPLTLFYRIAYRVTENTYKNVYKPLAVNGNPVNLLKYLGASYAAGAAQEALYHNLFGLEKNKYKDIAEKTFDTLSRAETLAIFSNAFNEYGSSIESYQPVVFRTITSATNNTTAVLMGKKTLPESVKDWAKENIVVYNKAMKLIDNNSFVKRDRPRVEKMQKKAKQWYENQYKTENPNAFKDFGTTRSPYYRKVVNSFWSDISEEKKANAYWSAYWYIAHSLEREYGYRPYRARKQAKANLKTLLSRQKPVSLDKSKGRKQIRDYYAFYNTLNKEERKELKDIEDIYYLRIDEFERAYSRIKYGETEATGPRLHFR